MVVFIHVHVVTIKLQGERESETERERERERTREEMRKQSGRERHITTGTENRDFQSVSGDKETV